MAVKEFLDAVDKKNKEEEAAMAADAPVSAEVVPEVAAPSVFGTPAPMESVVDTVGQAPAVQSPFSQAAAPSPMAAAVDLTAQPDVLAAAPAVQASPAPTQNGAMIGVPDFDAPYIYPEAAKAFGGVPVNMPPNPLDPNAQITSTDRAIAPVLGKPSMIDSAIQGFKNQNEKMAQSSYSPMGGVSTPSTAVKNVSGFGGAVEEIGKKVLGNLSDEAIMNRMAVSQGKPIATPAAATPAAATPAVETATPDSVANLSVNGTDTVTPEAITEAGQAAVTPQTPSEENLDPWRAGRGMVTRDLTGESFIDGSRVAATPEQVAAFNATEAERTKAGDIAARKRYEARLENERLNPTPAPTPRAPRRQSIQERDRSEKTRADALRKEGKRSIDDQMREFNREPHSTKERAAEKARLQGELNASIKEDRDYNRATTEANFANETAAYNRNTLTAAQRAADDGKVSIRDQIALRDEARGVQETQLAETQSYNNSLAAARSLVRDVGNIEDVAGTAKAQADSALTTGPGGLVMSILPGSKASDLRASLDTLTADSAFSALSEMRASSKTGGALGAISERELTLLGAAKRSLSANQSDEQLIKNINTYVEIRNRMMADAKLRFAQDYGVERANEAFGQSQGGASSIKNDRNVSSDAATEAFISKYNV